MSLGRRQLSGDVRKTFFPEELDPIDPDHLSPSDGDSPLDVSRHRISNRRQISDPSPQRQRSSSLDERGTPGQSARQRRRQGYSDLNVNAAPFQPAGESFHNQSQIVHDDRRDWYNSSRTSTPLSQEFAIHQNPLAPLNITSRPSSPIGGRLAASSGEPSGSSMSSNSPRSRQMCRLPGGPKRQHWRKRQSARTRDPRLWHPGNSCPKLTPSNSYPPLHYREAQTSSQGDPNNGLQQGIYDPYVNSASTMDNASHGHHQAQINPYAQDSTSNGNSSYFQQNNFTQPLQYHLYAPMGPHRENLPPYQRAVHDFFIPADLREELQRKSNATLQTLPSWSPSNSLYDHG